MIRDKWYELTDRLNNISLNDENDVTIWKWTSSKKFIVKSVYEHCDRTTSKVRGLSPKIILGDSRRSENAQTHTNKHTIPDMKFKLKLLQIKCHVLGFTKDEAQNVLQKIIRVCGSVRLSR
jgi:hypothetical protein